MPPNVGGRPARAPCTRIRTGHFVLSTERFSSSRRRQWDLGPGTGVTCAPPVLRSAGTLAPDRRCDLVLDEDREGPRRGEGNRAFWPHVGLRRGLGGPDRSDLLRLMTLRSERDLTPRSESPPGAARDGRPLIRYLGAGQILVQIRCRSTSELGDEALSTALGSNPLFPRTSASPLASAADPLAIAWVSPPSLAAAGPNARRLSAS